MLRSRNDGPQACWLLCNHGGVRGGLRRTDSALGLKSVKPTSNCTWPVHICLTLCRLEITVSVRHACHCICCTTTAVQYPCIGWTLQPLMSMFDRVFVSVIETVWLSCSSLTPDSTLTMSPSALLACAYAVFTFSHCSPSPRDSDCTQKANSALALTQAESSKFRVQGLAKVCYVGTLATLAKIYGLGLHQGVSPWQHISLYTVLDNPRNDLCIIYYDFVITIHCFNSQ